MCARKVARFSGRIVAFGTLEQMKIDARVHQKRRLVELPLVEGEPANFLRAGLCPGADRRRAASSYG
jgi:hypothetical protein